MKTEYKFVLDFSHRSSYFDWGRAICEYQLRGEP